jgi:competence ComEA-like helix-hairpin-helix protein
MKLVYLVILLVLPFVNAYCSNSQIDINSASLSSLDNLAGIGPTYAQRIIDGRPFSSLDDLIDVKGIGPTTLQKIKDQGLACVSEKVLFDSSTSPDTASKSLSDENPIDYYTEDENVATESIINLNSGQITSDEVQKEVVFESKNEKVRRYLIFAFALFLVLIIIFLLLTR